MSCCDSSRGSIANAAMAKLLNLYPRLYRRGVPERFEIGPGWLPLVEELSAQLERVIAVLPSVEQPRAVSIKSKFDELRFYIGDGRKTSLMVRLIQQAVERSATTCERCGAVQQRSVEGNDA